MSLLRVEKLIFGLALVVFTIAIFLVFAPQTEREDMKSSVRSIIYFVIGLIVSVTIIMIVKIFTQTVDIGRRNFNSSQIVLNALSNISLTKIELFMEYLISPFWFQLELFQYLGITDVTALVNKIGGGTGWGTAHWATVWTYTRFITYHPGISIVFLYTFIALTVIQSVMLFLPPLKMTRTTFIAFMPFMLSILLNAGIFMFAFPGMHIRYAMPGYIILQCLILTKILVTQIR
ncbi:MAG: hypothetical protein A2W23_00660 [Planctomycetes bacterium RBG_16_43_13]|nr:MAG: hypothetical protein A2W23_00660 [Planctomycetes bacterium RBG_16_43_13]